MNTTQTFKEWYWKQDFGDTQKEGLVSALEEIAEQAWKAGYNTAEQEWRMYLLQELQGATVNTIEEILLNCRLPLYYN